MTKLKDFQDWDTLYEHEKVENMPWFYEELDDDLEHEIKERNIIKGSFLDLCTGPGTQAIEMSKRGFTVTGIDISRSAIEKAKKLSCNIDFIKDYFLKSKLGKKFDYIFDRGCFHVISPQNRSVYVKKIKDLLNENSILFG